MCVLDEVDWLRFGAGIVRVSLQDFELRMHDLDVGCSKANVSHLEVYVGDENPGLDVVFNFEYFSELRVISLDLAEDY